MAKIDLSAIEEAHRHLCDEIAGLSRWLDMSQKSEELARQEIAKLREVNAAQADSIGSLNRLIMESDASNEHLREELRKAQERIRAAEAERDDARKLMHEWRDACVALAKQEGGE